MQKQPVPKVKYLQKTVKINLQSQFLQIFDTKNLKKSEKVAENAKTIISVAKINYSGIINCR